jgi:hypothetical protein
VVGAHQPTADPLGFRRAPSFGGDPLKVELRCG